VREPDDDFWKKIEEKKADVAENGGSTENSDTTQN
jgi:hypothetical protein